MDPWDLFTLIPQGCFIRSWEMMLLKLTYNYNIIILWCYVSIVMWVF